MRTIKIVNCTMYHLMSENRALTSYVKGLGKRWNWSHLCFLRYWKGGFYMIVEFVSFRPILSSLDTILLTQYNAYIIHPGVSGGVSTPRHPPSWNPPDTSRSRTPPDPRHPPGPLRSELQTRYSWYTYWVTQMWPNSPLFPLYII